MGEDYKQSVVKSKRNITAKLIQQKCFNEFNVNSNPFKDIMFEKGRRGRDLKRKERQSNPKKRKVSSIDHL